MSDLIDNGGYRYWEDDFSLQFAYEDCKAVFDGITDDDSFQECDTGLILYHAHEIMYALKKALLTAQPEQLWIPCTPDTMPDDLEEVYVTWVNHNPPSYYTEIKDKPFTAPAVYHRGKWYWYSSVCVDTLAEYGKNSVDEVDKDIEIVAWMPLPEPYGGEQE